jgi:hypothetical protein
MDNQGLRAGHLAALIGAAATLVSLALPWYTIHVPEAFKQALGNLGASSGAGAGAPGGPAAGLDRFAGELARGLAAVMPKEITGTGWQVLRGADVALCIGAVLVAVVVLASAGAFGGAVRLAATAGGRWISILGGAGLVLTTYHVIWRPAPAEIVELRAGLWVAAGGCLLALVGGAMASAARATPAPAREPRWVAEPADDANAHLAIFEAGASVPPPGVR